MVRALYRRGQDVHQHVLYRLTLPSTIAVHPNFNVKNLKAALPGVSGNYRPGPIYITDDGEYYEKGTPPE